LIEIDIEKGMDVRSNKQSARIHNKK